MAKKSVYEAFETDPILEEEGRWFRYGAFEFLCARAGGANKRFTNLLQAKMRPYERAINSNSMDEDLFNEILQDAYARAVLKDWRGVTNREGEDIPFNVENALQLFKDLPDLFIGLRDAALNMQNYLAAAREEDAGN